MRNVLACRATLDRLAVVAEAGLRHVEISLPRPAEVSDTPARLRLRGLAASSVQVPLDVRTDDGIAGAAEAFATVEALGATRAFTSVRADAADRADVYRRLRHVGDLAARHGLVVAIETHPDLAHSGEVALATMQAVDHPNVRINFDTGNVYYYNRGTDAVAELRKVAPYVAAVHLKDTTGGYESFDFPALGQGVVDFPSVFRALAEQDYAGPYTLEIEGLRDPDPEAAFARVLRESLDYLRRIGIA